MYTVGYPKIKPICDGNYMTTSRRLTDYCIIHICGSGDNLHILGMVRLLSTDTVVYARVVLADCATIQSQ